MLPREMLSKLVMIDSVVALGSVPLVRRKLFADRRRLGRSVAGIAFAVLLMMSQLGFRNAYVDSMLLVIDSSMAK